MLTPKQIASAFVDVGYKKATMPITRMFVLGIFAGIFIALAGAGSAIASAMVENPSVARFLNSLVFPAGLVMVLLAGSELFTGNSLMIIAVLKKKITIAQMLKNWSIVYVGNLLGSLFVVLLFVYGHIPDLFSQQLAQVMVQTAQAKVQLSFVDALLRGILCNVLVCIAVWVAMAATSAHGKIVALYLPIVVFVLCGFEHCVANMFCIPAGYMAAMEYGISSSIDAYGFFITNLVPVTIGNILGGCLIGIGYWYCYLKEEA